MKKIILLLFVISLLLPDSLAVREGSSCEYSVNGDSECDVENNIYCIDRVCTVYSHQTSEFCNDTDGNNEWNSGDISYLYRTVSGAFVEGTVNDGCQLDGSPVTQCSSGNCDVEEFVCEAVGVLPYSYETYECSGGCRLGKCLDPTEPDSWFSVGGITYESTWTGDITGGAIDSGSGLQNIQLSIMREVDNKYWTGSSWVSSEIWLNATGTENWSYSISFTNFSEGDFALRSMAKDNQNNDETSYGAATLNIVLGTEQTSCNYALDGDSECDTANNFYCIGEYCTELTETPGIGCIETGDQNVFKKETIEYNYRESDGTVASGTKIDSCSGTAVKEYFCISPIPTEGAVFDSNLTECENGCLGGICNAEDESVPVENNNLPETVSDSELLQYIDDWANEKLGETEEENDLKIQQILEIWKKG